MKCDNTLYIIASYACNLHCPHCSIRFQQCNTNLDKIKKAILDSQFDEYLLFGGEPLLDVTIFNELVATKKITSISTNLLLLTDDIAQTLKDNNIMVATSWNLKRFTNSQYEQWHKKLDIVDNTGINCTVLITLTNDLFEVEPQVLHDTVIAEIDKHKSVDEIKFEYLVDDNSVEYYSKCDEWLCKMESCWKAKAANFIASSIKRGNIHNCHNVYTITPDGLMHKGCPNSFCYKKFMFLDECSNCKYSNICQPCILQQHCSFPKKLFQLIQEKSK